MIAKRYEAAIKSFLRHARKHPNDKPKAYAKIAECYLRSNRLKFPDIIAEGIMLISQGDSRSAEYYYRLALKNNPKHFSSLRGLAEILPNDSTERCLFMEEALTVQLDTCLLIDLGDYYRSVCNDYDHAYGLYAKAQTHAPKDKTAYLRLNDLCQRMGRNDEAKEWSRRWQEASIRKRRFGPS